MLENLSTASDLALVMLGFGLIVFVHELGHFLAARWAGIRVLGFAIGFGPALMSFRKGMGLRAGSGEKEYIDLLKKDPTANDRYSPTEYRFNILPLGGYVKMLGQEDVNPNAVSDAPDSYQNCKPWKRMVVISAGVIMNIITAAVLFIVVFMAGLPVEPAKVGTVLPGSPGATAIASNADQAGVNFPGLVPGDEIIEINGRAPNSFSDLQLATAMAAPGESIHLIVRRPGVSQPLSFKIEPEPGKLTGLLEIGVSPSLSTRIVQAKNPAEEAVFAETFGTRGYTDLRPGQELIRIGENPNVRDGNEVSEAARRSAGQPFEIELANADGTSVVETITPIPSVEVDHLPGPGKQVYVVEHLLGLTPVMRVDNPLDGKHGLKKGDIFARIGTLEYPNMVQGMAEIKANRRKTIDVVVLRKDADGNASLVQLTPKVNRKGQLGFLAAQGWDSEPLVSMPIDSLKRPNEDQLFTPAAASAILSPGTRIVAVQDTPVPDFRALRKALLDATANAQGAATINLSVQRPSHGLITADAPVETIAWTIPHADLTRLRALGWELPINLPFEHEQTTRQASTPTQAIEMGLAETRRVMLSTYVTFARLVQGTVKVEHLKGPVGIAHIGTLIADRGFVHLLFFMALISVNLAVINFLPLPIVDGGQFLFILYEQFRGRPVPLGVQNAVTMAGLVLIASMFLIVTYNDIMNLISF